MGGDVHIRLEKKVFVNNDSLTNGSLAEMKRQGIRAARFPLLL